MSTDTRLGFIEITGRPREIGLQLGRFGRDIVHRHLVHGHAWASVLAFRADPRVAAMRPPARARTCRSHSLLQQKEVNISPYCRGRVIASKKARLSGPSY